METKIWVNITFNVYEQLKGKDEFLATLNQEGIVVQERKIWHPAACTGQEIDAILYPIWRNYSKFPNSSKENKEEN